MAEESRDVSPNLISSPLAVKSVLKDILKKLRKQFLRNALPERLKPISWRNSLYWVRYTLHTDINHYSPNRRPLSVSRLVSNLQPNLKTPIFIFGAPRSGTTFLGDCLAELPELSYHFEPVLTKAAVRYIYEDQWSSKQATQFYKTVYSWLMRIHLDGDLRFAEKTPQLCFILPFLAQTFPDAKFLHIVRDGRDAALSLSQKPWHQNQKRNSVIRDPDGYLCGPWARFWVEADRIQEFETTDDFHRCIWLWRKHVEAVLSSISSLSPGSYYGMKYETLIKEPEKEAERISDFLDIHSQESRQILKDSIIRNVKPGSLDRWRQELSIEQHEKCLQEAGSLLQKLDYNCH